MASQVAGSLHLLFWLLLFQPQLSVGLGDSATPSSSRGSFPGKSLMTMSTAPEKPEALPKDKTDNEPAELQEADVNIVESGSCRKIPKKELRMINSRDRKGGLCASAEGKDSCQGDSWGPLLCDVNERWVQVAVVSWGIGCGRRTPGVYADVTFYQRWIVREVNRSTRLDTEGCIIPCLCLLLLLASWLPYSHLPSPL